jgi:arylsulfatase A-like enzyme
VKALAPLLSVTLLAAASLPAPQAPPPNIVLFLVDDLGWQDTSVPFHSERTPLDERYHTPHLERLAARGIRFTSAYASAPVCTPTRTSLMTGRSPARNHITYWTLHADRDQSAAFPGIGAPAWNVNGLQPDDVTLPRLLRRAGYRTIHVGKAHFGAKGTPGADPARLGFDVNVAGHAAGAPGSYLGTESFSGARRNGARVWDVPGLEEWHGEDVYLTDVLAGEAAAAVQDAVAEERPFFLHFAPYAVHTPITANRAHLERYGDLDPREAAYATMIESVDAALGVLMHHLNELDVLDETIVVFTSDNGGLSAHGRGGEAHTHNAPLRSGKGSWYEGGVRVPQVIAWPGVTDGGGVTDVPVVTHDLFPTVLGWAGVAIPEDHATTLDGRDLAPLCTPLAEAEERDLRWHQPHFWGVEGPGIQPFTSIRRGAWKLVFRHADRGFELYDLAVDLGETRDLAEEHPDRVRDLAERLSGWCEEVGAQMSIDLETGEPIGLPRDYAPALR